MRLAADKHTISISGSNTRMYRLTG